MANPFSRTLRAVDSDSTRGYLIAICSAALLLCAGVGWLLLGSVNVYVTSKKGTFEAADYAHPLAPQVDGTLVAVHATLGAHVEAGDVLFALDAQPQERLLAEEQARGEGAKNVADSLIQEIDRQKIARDAARRALVASTAAGRARAEVARTTSEYSRKRHDVLEKLREHDLVAGLDSIQSDQDRAVSLAQLHAQQSDVLAAARSGRVSLFDRDVQLASLENELASKRAEIATSEARIQELTYEIERRKIRASIAGTLAAVATLSAGATIHAGDILGAIVPEGAVRVIAEFDAGETVGRVAAGQEVTIRVDQFPWTQYGVVEGSVRSVGTVAENDLVRVDIDVQKANPRIPVLHGLTGTAEVHVEHIRPYALLLRLAGDVIARSPASNQP